MDKTEARACELLSLLRREMNGAVAASMTEKGLVYGLNYGVSIADIRTTAAGFTPDHRLAMHIYAQDVREMRLAALLIAEPGQISPDSFPFWGEGITTVELASNGALSLFSKSPHTKDLIFRWLEKDMPPLLMYTAVMTAAADIMHSNCRIEWDWRQLLEVIYERVWDYEGPHHQGYLSEGIASMLLRLYEHPEVNSRTIIDYMMRIENIDPVLAGYLHDKVDWLLV